MNRTIKEATVKPYDQSPSTAPATPRRLHRSLKFRSQTEDSQRSHAIRVEVQNLSFTARTSHSHPASAKAGPKYPISSLHASKWQGGGLSPARRLQDSSSSAGASSGNRANVSPLETTDASLCRRTRPRMPSLSWFLQGKPSILLNRDT
jgi:hypothetical protein